MLAISITRSTGFIEVFLVFLGIRLLMWWFCICLYGVFNIL